MPQQDDTKAGAGASWRDVAAFTWHYWRPHKWRGFCAAALMLASVLLDTLVPVYTGKIVDILATGQRDDPQVWQALWSVFGVFVFFVCAPKIINFAAMRVWFSFSTKNMYDVVNDGMRKVQRFGTHWHESSFAGATVRKITRGMNAFDSFEDTVLMRLGPAVVIMAGMTVMLTVRMWLVGLVAALCIIGYCAMSIWMSLAVLTPRFRASAEKDSDIGATLADIITGNATVKAFGAETREERRFFHVTALWKKAMRRALFSWVAVDALRALVLMMLLLSMLTATLYSWRAGLATAGDVAMVLSAFFIVSGYLQNIGHNIASIQRAVGDMGDIIAFWKRAETVADRPDALPLQVQAAGPEDAPEDMIIFDNVHFRYTDGGRWIYQGLDARIRRGENVALVGPSGSGKSTFVKLLQRLYDTDAGRILVNGQDIAGVTLESLRQAVALVPQDPVLFHRSLSENIAYGRPDATKEDIIAAAQQAYAHDFIVNLKDGYDTLVGERGVKLSGGERQRVAIARAILADAPVLILDEATSSLDSVSEHEIQKALAHLMRGRTTITIAHRLSTIRRADRILVFEDGRIAEQGKHDRLMATNGTYRRLYDMQALGIVGGDDVTDNARA